MGNVVELQKKARVVLEKKKIEYVKANVKLATDISGSMYHLYNTGVVQETIERILGIGMNIDINKSIEVFAFGRNHHEIGTVNEQNANDWVNRVMMRTIDLENSTYYSGVMERIIKKVKIPLEPKKPGFFARLLGAKEEPKEDVTPTIVFFVTDGDNFDRDRAEKIIRDSSDKPIFWQFIGVGNESFSFLRELDEMEGRFIDNANFFQLNDLNQISDEQLYDRILTEFPLWLEEAKAKNVIS